MGARGGGPVPPPAQPLTGGNVAIFVVVAEGEHGEFVAGSLVGRPNLGVVLKPQAVKACGKELMRQGINIVTIVPPKQAALAKCTMAIFPDGLPEGTAMAPHFFVWKKQGKVNERDMIAEEARRVLIRRKLLAPL